MTVLPVVADVNWLLSALTQASAAMIAIVGGLLVTRYVALHAEQASAQRRVDDLERRLGAAETRQATAFAEFQSGEVDDLLDDTDVYNAALDAIAQDEQLDVPTVLEVAEHNGEGLDHELLKGKVEALENEVRAALSVMVPLIPAAKSQPNWNDFRRTNGVSASRPGLWRWVYEEMSHQAILAAREAEKKADHWAAYASAVTDPYIRFPTPAVNGEQRRSERERRRGTLDTVRAKVAQLKQERRLASENLDASRQPEGFSLAIQVLIVLSALGMGVPVILMTLGVEHLAWWWRAGTSLLFAIGVGLLLRFLLVYGDFLRESGRTSLPKNLFGLLKR